jgi:NADPH-dependent 2,4-dienoyl-CoA reductase/sulfur reductase-like enzyme
MRALAYDALVVGGGAAGMAAAAELVSRGHSVALVEREDELGGILNQCIHNGFGLHEFDEELTGPEYAARVMPGMENVNVFLETTVVDLVDGGRYKEAVCYSAVHGVLQIRSTVVVLAMGCRERNRGNVRIPGSRPAGIYTAGLAQRLVNIEGLIPGKDVVVVGSGDIGLIMARRMKWVGCNVHGVVEILPYPSGLTRNIVQCLRDFDIPLYLSHVVSRIEGKGRLERVHITPLEGGIADESKSFSIDCDTMLLSVGLIPENELSKEVGVELSQQTNGPLVDATMMSSVDGVFACGNVLHVHDLVDFVTEEARRTGGYASEYLRGNRPSRQVRAKAGANVRYVNPGKVNPTAENKLYLRPLIVKNNARLECKVDHTVIRSTRRVHIQPSEMVSLSLGPKDFEDVALTDESVVEISLT